MKILWSATSVKHLQESVEYIQGQSADGAITVRRRILETVWRIGEMPYSGREGRIEGTREAVVPRTQYIVAYRVSAQSLDVLGIWHASRLWPQAF
ncbi:MAG: type II toxin-antitoxin system RelE/ParE family toxin [Terracidiphilus sp.]|jgi:plasmid stabilization system protein ParE